MVERRVVKLERVPVDGAGKDLWCLRPGSRGRRWLWFGAGQMPRMDADEAYVELERVKGGWKVLRAVEAPRPPSRRQMGWPRGPRTLAECRRSQRARFLISCLCGARWQTPDAHCRAFDAWTIEALQRLGYWRCACEVVATAMIYEEFNGCERMVERWTFDTAMPSGVEG